MIDSTTMYAQFLVNLILWIDAAAAAVVDLEDSIDLLFSSCLTD